MDTFFLVLHVIICIVLVLLVMGQNSKGSDLGGGMGGGSADSVFSAKGGKNILSKLTIYVAIAFFCSCLILGTISVRKYKSEQIVAESSE